MKISLRCFRAIREQEIENLVDFIFFWGGGTGEIVFKSGDYTLYLSLEHDTDKR